MMVYVVKQRYDELYSAIEKVFLHLDVANRWIEKQSRPSTYNITAVELIEDEI